MNKLSIIGLVLVLLSVGVVVADENYHYGMMDNEGNFYRYGMMGEDGQFYDDMMANNTYYYGMMGGYGMMSMMGGRYGYYGMNMWGMSLISLIYLAIGTFIFSIIFWSTRNWLVKEKRR